MLPQPGLHTSNVVEILPHELRYGCKVELHLPILLLLPPFFLFLISRTYYLQVFN